MFTEKTIEKARKDKEEIAAQYNVPVTSVIWIGDNRYVVIKDGVTIGM